MFFNESLNIDIEKLPQILRDDYLKLKNFFDTNQKMEFWMYVDSFEASIKQCYISGEISKKQQVDLFHLIGIMD